MAREPAVATWPELDRVPVALVLSRADGTLVAVNQAWCRSTGLSAVDSAGLGWLQRVDPGERRRLLDAVGMIVGTDTQQELELTFVGRRTRWRLVRHDSGSVLMAVVDDGATAYREDPLLDLVSRLVPDLFSVGMGLAACANMLEGRARHKVEAAIYRLDEIIAEVRRAAWVEPVTDGATVAPRREVRAPRDLRPYVSSSVSPYPHQHAPDLGESI